MSGVGVVSLALTETHPLGILTRFSPPENLVQDGADGMVPETGIMTSRPQNDDPTKYND